MSENRHVPCPFCGGTELIAVTSLGIFSGVARFIAWVVCRESACRTRGPECRADLDTEAIAAAWEAWDAAGKREDAK